MSDAELLKLLIATCGSLLAVNFGMAKWMADRQMRRLDQIEAKLDELEADKTDATQFYRDLGKLEASIEKAHSRIDDINKAGWGSK